ncbi:hypothetical protein [Frigidibacter sp. MR17.24]|uniref:hypothetical protein n=1 Tax=Frigidibacter sp. MR17.24 TaxID=3127345 RepID=UPI0030131272
MSDAAALERLLRREAALLRAGEIGRLPELLGRKAELIARIEQRGATPAAVRRLQLLAARNGRLLAAAIAGVTSAVDHVEALRRAGGRLESYDARGRARVIATAPPGVVRKA